MSEYIYARISLDIRTTENQTAILRAQYPNAHVIEETVSGAKRKPKLDALINKLVKGDSLIVYAFDRLGRTTVDLLTLVDELSNRGVHLISMRERFDMTTSMGRAMMQIMAVFAEMERNLISERTKDALALLKSKGVRLGRPIGYASHRKGKTIERDPELIRRLAEYKRSGHSNSLIAKLISHDGYPMSRQTVDKIFKAELQHLRHCTIPLNPKP